MIFTNFLYEIVAYIHKYQQINPIIPIEFNKNRIRNPQEFNKNYIITKFSASANSDPGFGKKRHQFAKN